MTLFECSGRDITLNAAIFDFCIQFALWCSILIWTQIASTHLLFMHVHCYTQIHLWSKDCGNSWTLHSFPLCNPHVQSMIPSSIAAVTTDSWLICDSWENINWVMVHSTNLLKFSGVQPCTSGEIRFVIHWPSMKLWHFHLWAHFNWFSDLVFTILSCTSSMVNSHFCLPEVLCVVCFVLYCMQFNCVLKSSSQSSSDTYLFCLSFPVSSSSSYLSDAIFGGVVFLSPQFCPLSYKIIVVEVDKNNWNQKVN